MLLFCDIVDFETRCFKSEFLSMKSPFSKRIDDAFFQSGKAFSCGSNQYGQLGTGSCKADGKVEDNRSELVAVKISSSIAHVAAGSEFSMWLSTKGSIFDIAQYCTVLQ